MSGVCEWCGDVFDNKQLYGKYDKGRFCSERCSKKFSSSRNRKTVICSICGITASVPVLREDLCDTCYREVVKTKEQHAGNERMCKYCGQEPCISPDVCLHYRMFPILIRYFGFKENTVGSVSVASEFYRIRDQLAVDYGNMSVLDIAKKYKYEKDPTTLYGTLRSLNIGRRTLSDATRRAWAGGKLKPCPSIQYKHGEHTTWDKNVVYCRSSYEKHFCEYLDSSKIHYEMEPFHVEYNHPDGTLHTYVPDFLLPAQHAIVEIKNEWTFKEEYAVILLKMKSVKDLSYKSYIIVEKRDVYEYTQEDMLVLV